MPVEIVDNFPRGDVDNSPDRGREHLFSCDRNSIHASRADVYGFVDKLCIMWKTRPCGMMEERKSVAGFPVLVIGRSLLL
jgi:hypothetical protein